MVNANDLRDAEPWHPISDPVDLKHLGKLGEELTELSTAASKCASAVMRCIIQGVDEREPVTLVLNREWLEDEIADVEANFELTKKRLRLNLERMAERKAKKMGFLKSWHDKA